MRKLVLLSTLILTSIVSYAQNAKVISKNELDISYYSTDIGSNISAEFNKNIKKHTFIIGLKCHMNHYIKPIGLTGGYKYHKQFNAENFSDYIGATIGYEYHLKDINPYVSPYLLFNSQYANMKTKYRNISENANGYNITTTSTDGPFTVLENTIGFGLSIKLNDRFSLNQSGGIGTAFFQKKSLHTWDWEMMYQFRAGISVKLN